MPIRFRAARLSLPAIAALAVAVFPGAAFAGRKKTAPLAPPEVRASLPPSATIPVSQLGFAAPGEFYLGSRQSMVSLDFLDEDRLLFTFRVPGLFRRDRKGDPAETERHIRAVVLHIPDGAVQAQELWTVHDRVRYLYMMDKGQFAFRDRDTLQLGDASLGLSPWLHFPGQVYRVEFTPGLDYIVTDSLEPEAAQETAPKDAPEKPGQVTSPATAKANVTNDSETGDGGDEYVLRVLRRPAPVAVGRPQVMLFSRIRGLVHLPMNGQGYLEALRGRGVEWVLNLDYFTGGTTRVGVVDSSCFPSFDFVTESEFLAGTCAPGGGNWLQAFSLDGRKLWQVHENDTAVWPILVASRNGARVARETMQASHPVSASLPLSPEDLQRQQVNVYDAASGKQLLHAEPSPIFDAGGNVALSPSGRRAAVLMDGNIQVFELDKAGNRE